MNFFFKFKRRPKVTPEHVLPGGGKIIPDSKEEIRPLDYSIATILFLLLNNGLKASSVEELIAVLTNLLTNIMEQESEYHLQEVLNIIKKDFEESLK